MSQSPVQPSRFWIDRRSSRSAAVQQARQAVASLKPAAVITGGSRGIGLALARRFIDSGRQTVIVARGAEELAKAAASLKADTGVDVLTVATDVTDQAAPAVIDAELEKAGLYLDVLVNNAAVGLAGPFDTHSEQELSQLVALNIDALTRLTRHALTQMVARQGGGILNVASLGGITPGPNQAAYYASKAYVLSLTEAIANEVSGQGIRVTAVAPGPVNTGFHEDMGAEGSLYRWLLPALSAERVATSAYRGFVLGQRVVVPGLLNKFMYVSLRLLPHRVTGPIVGLLLRKPLSQRAENSGGP